MTDAAIGFTSAIDFVNRAGDALARAELAWLLRATPFHEDQTRALMAGQRADGAWEPAWAPGHSGVDATCYGIARALTRGMPIDAPQLQAAALFLAARQREDGAFEETPTLASVAPPWAMPGDPMAREYLTANAGFCLALLVDRAAAERAAEALDHTESGGASSQTRWLRGALRYRLGDRAGAESDLNALCDECASLEAADLAWMLCALLAAGVSGSRRIARLGIARLMSLRNAHGVWGEGHAPDSVHTTLDALAALRAAGIAIDARVPCRIERIEASSLPVVQPALIELLRDSVDGGASVGYLPPLGAGEARAYWRSVGRALAEGGRVLLVAWADGRVIGSAQLDLALRANGLHRAEVMKVMTHSACRGAGVGRALMLALEDEARRLDRTTLILDTRQGDPSEALYASLGWIKVGAIPRYARSASGDLHATAFYYKII